MTLTAAALLIGYPAIILLGRIHRHREAIGATVGTGGPIANVVLRLLHPVMWVAGRWWGAALLLVFWPIIFVALYNLTTGLLPILVGAFTFGCCGRSEIACCAAGEAEADTAAFHDSFGDESERAK